MDVCPECEAKIAPGSLARHMRTHSGVKDFTCDFPNCGRSFGRKDALRTHQRFHRRDAAHTCLECGKSFVQLQDLRRHAASHARVQSFEAMQVELASAKAMLQAFREQIDLQKRHIELLEMQTLQSGASANQPTQRDVCGCWKFCKQGSLPCAVNTLTNFSSSG
jgi:hypothetical protein